MKTEFLRLFLFSGLLSMLLLTPHAAGAQQAEIQVEDLLKTLRQRARDTGPTTDTVRGTVRWSGEIPPIDPFEVNVDERFCAPTGELPSDRADVDPVSLGVRNAVVWLKPTRGEDLPTPPTPINGFRASRMELIGCQFQPPVLVKPAEAGLWVFTRDDVLHQIVLRPPYGPERRANLGYRGAYKDWRTAAPGIHHLRCIRHPWEKAAVVVAEHAYYTVTDAAGTFTFSGVPPGEYQVMAWHDGMRVEKTMKAGLVTDYKFSPGVQTSGRMRVPQDTARPLTLTLKE